MENELTLLDGLVSETDALQYKRRELLYKLEVQSQRIQRMKDELRSVPPISEAFEEFNDL